MNWLTLDDRERLCRYAAIIHDKGGAPNLFRPREADSYFTEISRHRDGSIPDMTPYEVASFQGLREKLQALWKDSALAEKNLLINICCAAALKNEPWPMDYSRLRYEWELAAESGVEEQTARTAAGSAMPGDAGMQREIASVLVYEF